MMIEQLFGVFINVIGLDCRLTACGRALLRRPDFWAERQLSPTRLMERNNPKDACRRHSAIA
jgi:hypothetical protein